MKRLAALALVLVSVTAAGCGSSSSGGSAPSSGGASADTAAGKTAATTQITAVWTTFFNAATPDATALSDLEDGSTLQQAFAIGRKAAKKQQIVESAKVKKVDFTSPTAATVTYDLLSSGSPVLSDATGDALLVNGKWVVAKHTFCQLVQLSAGGKTLPGC